MILPFVIAVIASAQFLPFDGGNDSITRSICSVPSRIASFAIKVFKSWKTYIDIITFYIKIAVVFAQGYGEVDVKDDNDTNDDY